jgi:GNAT superfamily N-acetyltransferase
MTRPTAARGLPAWREEPISKQHDRSRFDCGVPALNEYLVRYARQNHESGGAKTFVAVPEAEPARIVGYYSISPGAIEFARTPAALIRKLGRYDVPVYRLGRLAVDRAWQGRGLGGWLLLAAGERALRVASAVGGVALAIDAKDERAAGWYEALGALRLLDDPLRLVLPLATIAAALQARSPRTPPRLSGAQTPFSDAPAAMLCREATTGARARG